MRRSYSRAGHFRYVPEGNGKLSASIKRVLLEEDLGVSEMYFRYLGIMTLHVLRSQSSTQQSVFLWKRKTFSNNWMCLSITETCKTRWTICSAALIRGRHSQMVHVSAGCQLVVLAIGFRCECVHCYGRCCWLCCWPLALNNPVMCASLQSVASLLCVVWNFLYCIESCSKLFSLRWVGGGPYVRPECMGHSWLRSDVTLPA